MRRSNWFAAGAAAVAAIAASLFTLVALVTVPPAVQANIVSGLPLLRGMAPQFQFRSGFYYPVQGGAGGATSGTYTNGAEFADPFFVPTTTTFTRIATWIAGAGSAGSVVRFGIYADNAGRPGNLVLDAGTAASTSILSVAEATISQSLTQGQYWVSVVGQGAPVTPPTSSVYSYNTVGVGYDTNTQMANAAGSYTRTGITGALTNWSGTATTVSVAVTIALKVQ